MPKRWLIAVSALAVWGIVSTAAQGKQPAPPPRANPVLRRPNNAGKAPINPVKELERFQKMSPEQRDKEMAKLRPAQRQRMERLLERFENMPPAMREQALRRLEALHELSPERRMAVTDELRNLRSLPPLERRARLRSDDIQQNFSEDERKLLYESVAPRFRPQEKH